MEQLDGLRAIAVLSVILLHWVVRTEIAEPFKTNFPHLYVVADLGWCGVDIFFVLSGFLIGGIIWDNYSSNHFLTTFYVRRSLRILPIYLLIVAIAAWDFRWNFNVSDQSVPLWSYFFFAQNFFTAFDKQPLIVLGPLWSLAIEEQFYVGGAGITRFIKRHWLPSMLILCVIASPLLRFYFLSQAPQNISPWDFTLCRLDGIAWGFLSVLTLRNGNLSHWMQEKALSHFVFLSILLLGIPLVAQLHLTPVGEKYLIAFGITYLSFTAAVFLLYIVIHAESLFARILQVQPLPWIGKVSYFLYVYHLLALNIVSTLYQSSFVVLLLSSILLLGLSFISWKYLEEPLIRIGKRRKY
jgi:peptidoglycan/LPS O-acetylase OafA/YrhL